MIAVDILTAEQIDEATVYCMRKRTSSFMPTTAEFIEIAERLEAEKAKEKRINEEIEESNRYLVHNQEGKKKVKEMALKIGSQIGKKEIEKPKIPIYESADQNGNLSYISFGEIPFDIFKEQVYFFCGQYPRRIVIEHKRFQKVKKQYSEDQSRVYSTYVTKDQPAPDTEPFTVGYL